MKSKIIYLLLITLLVTNCVMLFMLIKKPHERMTGGRHGAFLVEHLNFNEQQQKDFIVLDKEHRIKMMGFDDEIIKNKRTLFDSFSNSENINTSLTIKIGELEGKKEVEAFSFFKKVKALCDENQAENLEKIIKRAITNSGKKPERHMPGDKMPPHLKDGQGPPPPPMN